MPETTPPALVRDASWPELGLDLLRRWLGEGRGRLSTEELCRLGERHRKPMHHAQIESLYFRALGTEPAIQRLYDKLWSTQRAAAVEMLEELSAHGIDALVFKGAEIVPRWEGDRPIGSHEDVDLLIERPSIGHARRIFQRNGYLQAIYDPEGDTWNDYDVIEAGHAEATRYELVPLSKVVSLDLDDEEVACLDELSELQCVSMVGGRPMLLVQFDLHHGVMTGVDVRQFFERATPSALGVGSTMSPSDHLWFSAVRYYVETAMAWTGRLRPLCQLGAIARDTEIDWQLVLDAAAKHDAGAPLYYWLAFLNMLADSTLVDGELLAALEVLAITSPRNWGWQIGKLFDTVDPMPFVAP